MVWFLTEYRPGKGSGKYGCDIWAKSERHAEAICKKRGLGEKVLGTPFGARVLAPPLPSKLLRKRKRDQLDTVHAICFWCFIAMRSGAVTGDEVLSDVGLLHEVVHLLDCEREADNNGVRRELAKRKKELIRRFEKLERKVPGWKH
jgi:hypothetical protein